MGGLVRIPDPDSGYLPGGFGALVLAKLQCENLSRRVFPRWRIPDSIVRSEGWLRLATARCASNLSRHHWPGFLERRARRERLGRSREECLGLQRGRRREDLRRRRKLPGRSRGDHVRARLRLRGWLFPWWR